MNIQDALAQLAKQMGVDNVKLDENGVCRLVFDKKLTVDFEAVDDGKTLYVYSVVCSLPPEGRESFYARLLEANLFGQQTGGAIFAIDPAPGDVLLYRAFEMEKTDYQDFVNGLESFLNHLENWVEEVHRLGSGESTAPDDIAGGQSAQGFIRA